MGDTTSITLIVHDCPADRVSDVLDIVVYYGLAPAGRRIRDRIELGEPFQNDDISCGEAATIANELIAAAPELIFTVWEDPRYAWLGSVHRYTPDLGLFSADCDAEGTAVFTAAAVRELVDAGDAEALDTALGTPWETAIGIASATALSPVIAPRTDPTASPKRTGHTG